MQRISQELAGYRMPAYVEEILTRNYCSDFMRMSIIRENGSYSFSYRPDSLQRLDTSGMSLYDKLLLIRRMISISEAASDHLIDAESYLLEPELIYTKGGRTDAGNLKLMYYPDARRLDIRLKIVIFADRIMDRSIKEEREMAGSIRESAEAGDMNRIKLFLDKSILRLENRMLEGRSQRIQRA